MTYGVDMQEMRAYILDKFQKEGDFDFLQEGELEAMVDAMLAADAAYMEPLPEDGEYDDDAAYEALYADLQQRFPAYKMYAMRLSEDYLDFAEEYLVSVDALEWDKSQAPKGGFCPDPGRGAFPLPFFMAAF